MAIATCEKNLLDMLPEPTVIIANGGRVIFANRAGLELLQVTNAHLTGKDFSALVNEPSEKSQAYLRDCSRSAQFHIGRFTFKTGLGREVACRCDGARVESSESAETVMVRLSPRAQGTKNPFATLNNQIDALNRARHDLETEVRSRTADLLGARSVLRELSAKLMQAQDEERRRLARELHDSTGQILTGIQLNLSMLLSETAIPQDGRERLARTIGLTNQAIAEVRTLSHLLHPPLLDEAGLPLALRSFVEGFEERSKVSVTIEVPPGFERIALEIETAIFRIVQECLTNVHRHSGSSRATIRLTRDGDSLNLEVRDEGRGIPVVRNENGSSGKEGVGLRGMQERVRLLGGTIEFLSANPGTLVKVMLPCARAETYA